MKLIFCNKCQDVFKLSTSKEKFCECGKSSGMYIDELNAWYKGECVPLGFANYTLGLAIQNQPQRGWGVNFGAFVIAKECDTFKLKI